MPYIRARAWLLIGLALLVACRADIAVSPAPAPVSPQVTLVPVTATPYVPAVQAALALVSEEQLFATLEDLTAIRPYAGWRTGATEGEREALDYVAGRLDGLGALKASGLEVERQQFDIFMTTHTWRAELELRVGGRAVEVPAGAMRGHRDEIQLALRFDSDRHINDTHSDPISVEGPVVVVHTRSELRALDWASVQGKLVFLDYALVDQVMLGWQECLKRVDQLLNTGPAGIVLVTTYSNAPAMSHGTFVPEGGVFSSSDVPHAPPMLYVTAEDLAAAGVSTWGDAADGAAQPLAGVESARLTWDTDVVSPATSGNLVARIPGEDPSRAVILGAHIDSPNNPGALDNGSGSAVLVEVARVLDAAGAQPPVDLYLVWFGAEEPVVYGSYHFIATHQDLLDRTIAMLNVDSLTRPLDGIDAALTFDVWSYSRQGDERLPWTDYLTAAAGRQGILTRVNSYLGHASDNSGFNSFDVPNANLMFSGANSMESYGGPHYAGHMHDPYDTVELAREVGDEFVAMARVAVLAALETGDDARSFRVTPRPDRRALFLAGHTEPLHMNPSTFTDLCMVLAMSGYDVDMLPYGRAVTPADLADADIVFALPVIDYPTTDAHNLGTHDEAWTDAEVTALEQYVAQGGFLVMTDSAHRLRFYNQVFPDSNEDVSDMNRLAGRFGVKYDYSQASPDARAGVRNGIALTDGVTELLLAEGNAVPFSLTGGQVLAATRAGVIAALVDYGASGGQVLALADVGILGQPREGEGNTRFWQNVAEYVHGRE